MSKYAWEKREPEFNILDYNGSITRALSFYNAEVDHEVKKSWTIDFWKTNGKMVDGLEKTPDWAYAQVGVLVRLISRGVDLSDHHKAYINDKYTEVYTPLSKRVKHPPKIVKTIKAVPQDRNLEIAKSLGSDIDAEIDYIVGNGKRHVNIKTLFTGHGVTEAAGVIIASRYEHQLKEFQEELETPSEHWSHLSRKTIKFLHDCLADVMVACQKSVKIRKARKTKPVDPSKVVAKLKYLKSYPDLNLESVNPELMVGSNEIWLFNVKVRKLFKYVANKGGTLTIKGTKILDFDDTMSSAKTIRKPEVFFSPFNDFSRSHLNRDYDKVPSVSVKVPGCINADMIIFQVF